MGGLARSHRVQTRSYTVRRSCTRGRLAEVRDRRGEAELKGRAGARAHGRAGGGRAASSPRRCGARGGAVAWTGGVKILRLCPDRTARAHKSRCARRDCRLQSVAKQGGTCLSDGASLPRGRSTFALRLERVQPHPSLHRRRAQRQQRAHQQQRVGSSHWLLVVLGLNLPHNYLPSIS